MKHEIKNYIFIVLLGALFFLPFLGEVHLFDWDEINFAEAAREMIKTGDYLNVRIDYEPFHEKPPLFIWTQVVSMYIFGINEFAARFPNAIIGIISLVFIYAAGRNIFNEKFGLLWVLAYIGSLLPHFYFKSGIIDPLFNLFMFTSVFFILKYSNAKEGLNPESKTGLILLASILCSMAVMTKGPVGFLLVFLTWFIFWIFRRTRQKFPLLEMSIFTAISFIPIIIWYALVLPGAGFEIVREFIGYQIRLLTTGDAGHSGPFYYHFVVLFFGVFPASMFIFSAFKNKAGDMPNQKNLKLISIILLCVVLVIFSIVQTKIIHYSSLAYYPITFLAAYTIYHVIYRQGKWKKHFTIMVIAVGLILSLSFTAFPIIMYNIDSVIPKISDRFTKELLKTEVRWSGYEFLTGIFYFIFILASFIYIIRKEYLKTVISLFGSTAIIVFMVLSVLAPKIEPYTQGAPIDFYTTLKGKDVYVEPLGYKSYAHLFYTKKPPYLSQYISEKIPNDVKFRDWLLEGDINRDAYFVAKNKKADKYIENYDLEVLYRKGGFVFMKRNKPKD